MTLTTKDLSVNDLLAVFQYPGQASLSEAIVLSSFSIHKANAYLPVEDYRNNVFSILWKRQFHHGKNWTAQYRSELNQGAGRLAFRVFESPANRGWKYRLKAEATLSPQDQKTLTRLRNLFKKIEQGLSPLEYNDEEQFQNSVQIATPVTLPAGKIPKPDKKRVGRTEQYARNPGFSKAAIINAGHKCQYDNSHVTFDLPQTNNNFVEAHHLIPMQYQEQFEYSIDVPENIIPLCPNCHRRIHKSGLSSKEEMLVKLFSASKQAELSPKGISVSFSELLNFYKGPI